MEMDLQTFKSCLGAHYVLKVFPLGQESIPNTCHMLGFVFGTSLRRMSWTPAHLTVLTLLGSTSLDQDMEGHYQLLVQVKDMGDQASGHQATATIDVSMVENTWVPLDAVHLAENLKVPYPHHIAQVSKRLSMAEVAPWMVQLGLGLKIWRMGLRPSLAPAPLLPMFFPLLSPSVPTME